MRKTRADEKKKNRNISLSIRSLSLVCLVCVPLSTGYGPHPDAILDDFSCQLLFFAIKKFTFKLSSLCLTSRIHTVYSFNKINLSLFNLAVFIPYLCLTLTLAHQFSKCVFLFQETRNPIAHRRPANRNPTVNRRPAVPCTLEFRTVSSHSVPFNQP